MSTLLMVWAAILAVFLGYTVIAPTVLNFARFAGKKVLTCPHLHEEAEMYLNPFGAALSAGYGNPRVEISKCSLWKRKLLCDKKCLEGQEF